MRAKYVALFFIGIALAWGIPAHAAVVDSQLDDSAQAIRPSGISFLFLAAGYVPPHDVSIYGVRFRVNKSNGGKYVCPTNGGVMRYYGTSTPPTMWGDSGNVVGSLVNIATTTPDSNGNCDYTTLDKYARDVSLSLSSNYYHVFFMNEVGPVLNGEWVSMSGKPYASTTPVSLFGFRNAFSYYYEWGTTGLDAPYFEFFDTASPAPATVIPPSPCATPGVCASNVLFLPGIEGSRLYEGTECGKTAEEKLWEPYEGLLSAIRGAGDDKVRDLFLDQAGDSVCGDIYAKEGGIIDSAGGDIYKSFIAEMNGLKTDGTIADWKPVAYDWRLSLDDLLNNGAEHDGKIFYAKGNKGATSTPYIEQTLRALAGSSKTGKVTIIAHSNGGLVAKALLNKLGDAGAAALVDKVIMVGAPQSGAPLTIGALLYGYDQGLPNIKYVPNFIVSASTVRALAENSPMAYHLLPSQNYLDSVATDTNHPVARFAGDAYAKEISVYGATITSTSTLDDFLLASTTLNSSLIDYANSTHATLDNWTPPAGIEVDQIAGWGADTVAGIDFYTPTPTDAITALEPQRKYNPIFTEDGDGTVPVPSALMMASSTNVKRYWLNLYSYNYDFHASRTHKDLFEIPSLEDFIKNTIKNSTSTLPAYISTTQPSANVSNKKLTFFLHSPLTLQLTDSSGNITGLATDDSITENIPDSTYGEFGEVKYVIAPEGNYQLTLHGQASGTFSLDMQETTGDVITASSTIANVPTTANTLATLNISGGIDTASALSVDENGDGGNVITIAPVLGKTVNYVPPASTPAPAPSTSSGPTAQVSSSGGGGGSISIPVVMSTQIIPATTTLLIASTTPATTTPVMAVLSPRPSIAARNIPKRLLSSATVANTMPNFSQTASVYAASQQSFLKMVGTRMYTGFYRMWIMLIKLF